MYILESLKKYAETDRIALRYRGGELSFAELDRRSDAFAAWLLKTFGGDRTPIMIYGHKELCIPACMFGALKAGRGYVPVDTTFPRERAAQIAEEVRPKLIVDLRGLGLEAGVVLDGDALEEILTSGERVSRESWIQPEQVAYILFTSGSTGRPKGVQVTAGGIAAFDRGMEPYLALEEDGGVFLNQISYSFDISVIALYFGLSRGMTLYTVDKETLDDLPALFAALRESRMNVWASTPSLPELCCQSEQFCQDLIPAAKKFIFGGELMTCKLGRKMLRRFPRAKIYNCYGPTETSVVTHAVEVTEALCDSGEALPIGYPFPHVGFDIVDPETGASVAEGETGELLLMGPSVSPGYLGRPELNERSFFVRDGVRGYHSGDLCYFKDGLTWFVGRLDGQVKLNGYRVELEDVESNMARLPNIARAAVVPVRQDGKVQSLTAFVKLEQPDGLSSLQRAKRIKAALASTLPSYMIPRKILAVDSFPLNNNGKIDKKALLQGGNPL